MRDNHNFAFHNPKHNCRSSFETHCADTRLNVVSPNASLRESLQSEARGFDAVYVAAGNGVTGLLGDIIVERKQVCFGQRTKTDLKLPHPPLLSPVPRGAYAGA
jgi:hypothetical protein